MNYTNSQHKYIVGVSHKYEDYGFVKYYISTSNNNISGIAIYLQFLCEIYYGAESNISLEGIAHILVKFYDCDLLDDEYYDVDITVDMYTERETRIMEGNTLLGQYMNSGTVDIIQYMNQYIE